jgi:hypothetical protein
MKLEVLSFHKIFAFLFLLSLISLILNLMEREGRRFTEKRGKEEEPIHRHTPDGMVYYSGIHP